MNWEFWRWSKSLPGVQISKLTPFYNFLAYVFLSTPPIKTPTVFEWNSIIYLATLYICKANSLVGVITMTPVPCFWVNYNLYKSSMHGIKKANVLPDPVLAAPITSLPFNKYGRVLAWICVILS